MSKLDKLIKGYEKAWDAPNLMDLAKAPRGAKIPFSAPLMNWTTYGGIPRNKITEFHGPEGGGKSTSAVDICKNAMENLLQRTQKKGHHIRAEKTVIFLIW
jgi:RecA/RadA recombinase